FAALNPRVAFEAAEPSCAAPAAALVASKFSPAHPSDRPTGATVSAIGESDCPYKFAGAPIAATSAATAATRWLFVNRSLMYTPPKQTCLSYLTCRGHEWLAAELRFLCVSEP